MGAVNDPAKVSAMTNPHRLSDRVIWLVGRAAQQAQRLVQAKFVAGPIRKPHYGVLASLADGGPAAQAPLSDRIGIDRSDMVSLLDDLEELGYVVRRADRTDRRRKIVDITDDGTVALKELDRLVHAADDQLVAPLTADERATLAGLLARILPEADAGRR